MARFVVGTTQDMGGDTQLLGISNAIVDVLTHVDEQFLEKIGAPRGSMTLIDEQRAHQIYEMMGPATEMSGGSVANSIAGFANLGGSAAYIGRVKDDQLGEIFIHDMRSLGIDVRLKAAKDGSPTARSHILIDQGGQRTMQTYLGACAELGVADVTAETVGRPAVILIEGYVWDIAEGPALAKQAMKIGKSTGSKIALSLSDSYCVQRHRDEFENALREDVDIVVADEDEIVELLQAANFDDAVLKLSGFDKLFVMTRSEKGSVVMQGEQKIVQAASPVEKIIDTTGAGDAYAAGFLYGYTQKKPLEECAKLGTFCATAVIQQIGARIEQGLIDKYRSNFE